MLALEHPHFKIYQIAPLTGDSAHWVGQIMRSPEYRRRAESGMRAMEEVVVDGLVRRIVEVA